MSFNKTTSIAMDNDHHQEPYVPNDPSIEREEGSVTEDEGEQNQALDTSENLSNKETNPNGLLVGEVVANTSKTFGPNNSWEANRVILCNTVSNKNFALLAMPMYPKAPYNAALGELARFRTALETHLLLKPEIKITTRSPIDNVINNYNAKPINLDGIDTYLLDSGNPKLALQKTEMIIQTRYGSMLNDNIRIAALVKMINIDEYNAFKDKIVNFKTYAEATSWFFDRYSDRLALDRVLKEMGHIKHSNGQTMTAHVNRFKRLIADMISYKMIWTETVKTTMFLNSLSSDAKNLFSSFDVKKDGSVESYYEHALLLESNQTAHDRSSKSQVASHKNVNNNDIPSSASVNTNKLNTMLNKVNAVGNINDPSITNFERNMFNCVAKFNSGPVRDNTAHNKARRDKRKINLNQDVDKSNNCSYGSACDNIPNCRFAHTAAHRLEYSRRTINKKNRPSNSSSSVKSVDDLTEVSK